MIGNLDSENLHFHTLKPFRFIHTFIIIKQPSLVVEALTGGVKVGFLSVKVHVVEIIGMTQKIFILKRNIAIQIFFLLIKY